MIYTDLFLQSTPEIIEQQLAGNNHHANLQSAGADIPELLIKIMVENEE